MRVIAIDVGDKRIGIATSDPLGIIANGYETYHRKNIKDDMIHIVELCKNNDANTIVVGMPYTLDGSEGEQAKKTREFVKTLAKYTDINVEYIDERFTSVIAGRSLVKCGLKSIERKQVIDKVAATIILQDYLDKKNKKINEELEMADKKVNDEMNESESETTNVVVFLDEDGNEQEFEEIAFFEYSGKYYSALSEYKRDDEKTDTEETDENEEEETALLFAEVKDDENGDENYEIVDDDDLLDNLYTEFLSLIEKDGEDCECDDDDCKCNDDDCDCRHHNPFYDEDDDDDDDDALF
ncbi:MAG: Holliday junction resolvase RuvX [Christensenellaceae bacterium]|jgi:putative Holliday junction resolvase|nr:Holliday junction resolvase RuvX [Christensenellaceae bacterium]